MSEVNLKKLIFDRTQLDLEKDTDKAYISYIDLNRVECAMKELSLLLGVKIETKEWSIEEYRLDSEMKRLKENLTLLNNSYYKTSEMPTIPAEITYTSIYQANDIEKLIHEIWQLYKSVQGGKYRLSFRLGNARFGNRKE